MKNVPVRPRRDVRFRGSFKADIGEMNIAAGSRR